MNISIQGEIVAYHSDYSATSKLWKVHLRDAFRMVTLGSTECFVKRFASKPRAWDFMVASKGKRQTGLPIVYDAVSVTEGGVSVYYLFLEKIEGDTLHDLMKDKADGKPSVSLMAKALTAGFRTFHSQGYWHADFCAKNIMVATGGRRFVVIDLDSLEPVANRPTPTPNELGYIPDQELAMYALTYVQSYIDPKIKSFSSIPGPALNHLQLVFLLDKLTYFSCVLKAEGAKFRQLAAFKGLPQLVHQYLGGYTDQLVKRILDRTVDSEMVITQPAFFEKELPRPQASASLLYFKASSYSVLPGESTQLTWEVVGASSVHITNLGIQAAKGSITVPHNSGLVGEKSYMLTANGDSIRHSIKVNFVNVPLAYISPSTKQTIRFKSLANLHSRAVAINTFVASAYLVKEGEQTVIDWDVSGAGNVYITNIGTVPAKGLKTFNSNAFSGRTEFELTAGSPAVKKSFFVEFPVAAAQPVLVNWNASPPAVVTPVPALSAKSKISIWPFLVGFCLILAFIGFLMQDRSLVASGASTFIPNQERGLQLFDEFKYDSSFIHLVNFRNDTSYRFATQYNLAVMYDLGKGITVNDTLANSLYWECIRSTTPTVVSNALFALGTNYLLGKGCAQDVVQAKKCFAYAAEKYNNTAALNELNKLNGENNKASLAATDRVTSARPELVSQESSSFAQEEAPRVAVESSELVSSWPRIEIQSEERLNIKRVVQLKNYTRVDFVFTLTMPSHGGNYLSPPGSPTAFHIEWAGSWYNLKKTTDSDGGQLSDDEKTLSFSAYFEKIPDSATIVNIKEGYGGIWKFEGVHLSFH
ncbi:lipopolysaccharide kinase InaA family protein [Hymenobacter arizonensis]|uniref:Sel1 repeat-containing protein n=1 Tax=Hymenobacter arizonensis TaxID=1227077 RepID=A0A1I5Z7N9_HYMAR|nr:lipopolysaccharide kinase InaA family protein [Hymenobacter arizonensis]SFQ52489.1 Sel1 repeat-containing protein [Hymenobacter arizonensis]